MKAIHVPPIHTNKYENSQSDEKHISGCPFVFFWAV